MLVVLESCAKLSQDCQGWFGRGLKKHWKNCHYCFMYLVPVCPPGFSLITKVYFIIGKTKPVLTIIQVKSDRLKVVKPTIFFILGGRMETCSLQPELQYLDRFGEEENSSIIIEQGLTLHDLVPVLIISDISVPQI